MDKKRKENTETKPPERSDLELLAIGKRAGLSFEEINEFRVRDLVAYVDIIIATSTKSKKKKPREATQADIDAFYSRNF